MHHELNLIYCGRDGTSKFIIKDKDFIVSTKVDGIKCICIVDDGKSSFFTRQGKKIEELNQTIAPNTIGFKRFMTKDYEFKRGYNTTGTKRYIIKYQVNCYICL